MSAAADNATILSSLTQARADLTATLAAEEAYQRANGPKPTYSLDGESYDFPGYRKAALDAIISYTETINKLGGTWEVQSGNCWW